MKTRILLIALLSAASIYTAQANKPGSAFAVKDIFQNSVFLQNQPGLINDYYGQPIRYYTDREGVTAFFTDHGLVYRLGRIDSARIAREHRKDGKEDHDDEAVPLRISYVSATWVGANPHPRIEALGAHEGYYTYMAGQTDKDLHSIITQGYSRIIYHDLYPGIDAEYTLPEKGGMKYSLIVHPGADLSLVKISYGKDAKRIVAQSGGDLIIHSPAGDMMEHAPVSYMTDGSQVASAFSVSGMNIVFNMPQGYDHSRTLIVDPWVLTLTQLVVRNMGTMVDHDIAGNVYVYGAGASNTHDMSQYQKVAKFDPSGTFLWAFQGSVASISWSSAVSGSENYISGFKVDKVTGKSYLGRSYWGTGTQAIRITTAGVYDNFVSVANSNFVEIWSIVSNCITGDLLALGGGTTSNLNMGVINPTTAAVTTSNVTGVAGSTQDVVCGTYDAFGSLYMMLTSGGVSQVNNMIYKVNNSYNGNVWAQPNGYGSFAELYDLPSAYWTYGANNFNSLSANGSYLYYYDGSHLKAFNINTGLQVGTAYTIPGYQTLYQGGIAADACNNIYVGGEGVIKTFTFNGSVFTPGADISLGAGYASTAVLDVRLDPANTTLYVTGMGIVGTYIATPSIGCTVVGTFTSALQTSCSQSIVRVTPSGGLTQPNFSYIWRNDTGGVVRSTPADSILSDTLRGLPPGNYSVQVLFSVNCVGSSTLDSFTIVCNPSNHSPDTVICLGQPARIWYSPTQPGGTFLWQPGGGTDSFFVVSPTVTTTYHITYTPPTGPVINDSVTVYVNRPSSVNVSQTICAGSTYNFHGHVLDSAGTYRDTLVGLGGCDSTVILTLSLTPTVTTNISQNICAGSSYTFAGQILTAAGTYRDTATAVSGCDSIIVLALAVTPIVTTPVSATICLGSTYDFYGQRLSAAGQYTNTLTGSTGCDSIISLTLNMVSSITATDSQSICSGSSYSFGGRVLTQAGVYIDTFSAAGGCDSIVHLTLALLTRPVAGFVIQPAGDTVLLDTISAIDQSLYADTVLWLLNEHYIQLTSGHLPITDTGTYCIRLIATTHAGCSDTSSQCIYVFNPLLTGQPVFVLPNAFTPNGDGVNDTFAAQYLNKDLFKEFRLTIYNRWGEKVFDADDIDVGWDGRYRNAAQPPGVYLGFVHVIYSNGKSESRRCDLTLIR